MRKKRNICVIGGRRSGKTKWLINHITKQKAKEILVFSINISSIKIISDSLEERGFVRIHDFYLKKGKKSVRLNIYSETTFQGLKADVVYYDEPEMADKLFKNISQYYDQVPFIMQQIAVGSIKDLSPSYFKKFFEKAKHKYVLDTPIKKEYAEYLADMKIYELLPSYVFDQEGKFKKLKRKIQKIKNLILQRLSFYV